MASTYSPTLRLELIGTGDQPGVWGDTTNTNLGALVEQAITGVTTITMTDNNYTLSALNGAVDEARSAVLVVAGTNSAQRNVIAPLVDKTYIVKNETVGGFDIQIIGDSGTGVLIPNGKTISVYCDGTNFYQTSTSGGGGGGVVGPVSSTNNGIPRFDGTAGDTLKNSNVVIDNLNNLSTGGALSAGTTVTVGSDLVFSSSTPRILGDFSGVGTTERLIFQTNQANEQTGLRALPNGSGTNANFAFGSNSANVANTPLCSFGIDGLGGAGYVQSFGVGTGVGFPLVLGATTTMNPTERMRITTDGRVIVGSTASAGSYNLQCWGTGIWAQGSYVNGSDAKIKDNVAPLDSCLDVVKAMRPVTYQYKASYSDDQSVQPGFVAQDLQGAMAGKPYLEGVVKDDKTNLNVAYQNIIPILTKAIQEQQEQIEQLKAEVAALKGA